MKCSEAQDVLSAYHDGELPEAMRVRVAKHLHRCPDCAQELRGFKKLSHLASGLGTPAAPSHLWSRLEEALDRSADAESLATKSGAAAGRRIFEFPRLAGFAATVLVAIGIGWFIFQGGGRSHNHQHFTADFGHYLVEFRRDPQAAQQFLLAKYENQPVVPEEAIHRVGYRPAVADGLPPEYTLDSTHVMKMPCCTCVQTLCRRPDGSALAVFEHNDDDPRWFGDRPAITASCNGERCCLVELDGRLAASWKRGDRYITLVGVRDLTEVNQMVAWFNERNRSAPH